MYIDMHAYTHRTSVMAGVFASVESASVKIPTLVNTASSARDKKAA